MKIRVLFIVSGFGTGSESDLNPCKKYELNIYLLLTDLHSPLLDLLLLHPLRVLLMGVLLLLLPIYYLE